MLLICFPPIWFYSYYLKCQILYCNWLSLNVVVNIIPLWASRGHYLSWAIDQSSLHLLHRLLPIKGLHMFREVVRDHRRYRLCVYRRYTAINNLLTASRLLLCPHVVILWHLVVLLVLLWRRAAVVPRWCEGAVHSVVANNPWKLVKGRLVRGGLTLGHDGVAYWKRCLEKLGPSYLMSTALKGQAKQMVKTEVVVTDLIVKRHWWLFRPCVYLPTHQWLFCYLDVVGSNVPCNSNRAMSKGDLLDRCHRWWEFCGATAHIEKVGAWSDRMISQNGLMA